MKSTEPPFLFYRNAVHEIYLELKGRKSPSKDSRTDQHFYDDLERAWQEAHLDFRNANNEQSRESARAGMFLCAVGLLTFGRLDVVDDMLDWNPGRGVIRKLLFAIEKLLPLPEDLDPKQNPAETKAWIKSKEQQLLWSEQDGIFELRSENAQ